MENLVLSLAVKRSSVRLRYAPPSVSVALAKEGFALFFKSTLDYGGHGPLHRAKNDQGITDVEICDPFLFPILFQNLILPYLFIS